MLINSLCTVMDNKIEAKDFTFNKKLLIILKGRQALGKGRFLKVS